MADIIVLVIIAGAAVVGYKKGLVHSVFNLGYHLVALIAAAIFYPVASKWLTGTKLYSMIFDAITKRVADGGFINVDALPDFMQQFAQAGINAAAENTAATVTNLIVTIVSIVIVFIVVKLALSLISKVVNGFARLPVIKGFNKLGGFAFGILSGIVIVYVVLAIAAMFPESQAVSFIKQGTFAHSMYNNNLVMKCIFK